MKKLFIIMMTVAVIIGFGTSVYATDTCQVTLTSPAIVKTGCEKVGAITFSFDAGTVLSGGDWFYMDLPGGTSICSAIDYIIAANLTLNDLTDTANYPGASASDVALGIGLITTIPAIPVGTADGPMTITDLGAGSAAPTVGGLGIVLRVKAAANSQRVWVYVYGAGGGVGDTFTVGSSTTFDVSILDGQAHNLNIILNSNNDTLWGEETTDRIGLVAGVATGAVVPFIENTLCVNAEQMSGSLMFTSFASLNDFLTFTGDSQIAHVASANPLALAFCKGDTTGNILIGGQGACNFDFEPALSYCPSPPASFAGNRIFIQGATTFGDPGDKYDIRIYSDTPGVYFTAAPVISGFTPAATTECTAVAGGAVGAPAYIPVNEAGTTGATYAGVTCAVTAANRVREIRTTGGDITGIDTYDALFVNLPIMSYDTSVAGDGTAAVIRFSFRKYPCGEIFTASHTIGTLVTTCPVGAGGSTLLYPFLPPLDGSVAGWWGGFLIVNGSTAAGTVDLTLVEADGDTATFTTPSIAAGGQWNAGSLADFLASVTLDSGNTGTFGDANCAVTAVCAFNLGG